MKTGRVMLRMLPLVDMTYLARSGEAKKVVWCSSASRTGIQRYKPSYGFHPTLRQLNTIDEQEKDGCSAISVINKAISISGSSC